MLQQRFARMLQRAGQTARRLAQQTSLTSLKQWGEGLQQPVTSVVAEKMPSWIMLGPPGVGKGTYSSRVAKLLGISHISAGDLVRDEIKNQTECGQQARGLACRGRSGGAVSCNADWDCEVSRSHRKPLCQTELASRSQQLSCGFVAVTLGQDNRVCVGTLCASVLVCVHLDSLLGPQGQAAVV